LAGIIHVKYFLGVIKIMLAVVYSLNLGSAGIGAYLSIPGCPLCTIRACSESSLTLLKSSSFLPAVFKIIELDYAMPIAGFFNKTGSKGCLCPPPDHLSWMYFNHGYSSSISSISTPGKTVNCSYRSKLVLF
jgi:hypothetical protein